MAAKFNGTNQFLTAPLSFPGYPFTLSCKINIASYASTQMFIVFDTPIANNYRRMSLSVAQTGSLIASISNDVGNNNVSAESPSGAIQTNTAYTVSAVFANNSLRSCFVGTTKYTNTALLSISAPTRFICGALWRNTVNDFYVNGSMSEIGVWNAALTDSEIASLGAGYTPGQVRPQSLQFYAPLVRTFQDLRGGLAITNNNGATVATHPRAIT